MTRMITAIQPQTKDPKRVSIFLDGEFAFGVTGILAAWLKVGQTLTEEKINTLVLDDQLESTYQKALHFISYRPRSVAEVKKNLARRNVSEIQIDETIKHLLEASILNDSKFAHDWVANRIDFSPRGHLALRMELRQKGISEEEINKVLEETTDEESLALQAAQKYKHRLESVNKIEFRKKINNYLARKGFSFSSINPVISVVWNELHPEAEYGEPIHSEEY